MVFIIKRFISVFLVLACCLSLVVFSVSAESTGAEFFDFDQYATYEELPDTDEVKATITLPNTWYISYLSGMDLPPMFGSDVFFEVQRMFGPFSVHTSPFGSLWNYYEYTGSNTHILDLSLMPKDFVLYGGFTFEYFGEFNFQTDFSEVYVTCFNEYGEPIDNLLADDYLSIYENQNGYVHGEYEFVFDSSNLQYAIGDIKGITFQFDLGLFLNAGSDSSAFTIAMNPFEMDFLTTNAFINNRNDRIIRDKLSNIEQAINGPANPIVPDGQDTIDKTEDLENEILDSIMDGLNAGNEIFDGLLDTILEYSTSILAVGQIFMVFEMIPFFKALVLISLSLSIISILFNILPSLGRSINDSSSSKKQKGG